MAHSHGVSVRQKADATARVEPGRRGSGACGEELLSPYEDPFYDPPPGYSHAGLGSVLRSRHVELAFLGRIRLSLPGRQLLYRSTNRQGGPEVSVTTVLEPPGRDKRAESPILSYQCAIDAISRRCFPSYALRNGARSAGLKMQLELILIVAALLDGWTVSIPDHEGLCGTWGAPREPGYRVLDGVRAAMNAGDCSVAPDAPVALWGYSCGGLASAWAAEMGPTYAPELNIVGAALGCPVSNFGNAFGRLDGTLFAGLPLMMVAALMRSYPDFNALMRRSVTAKGGDTLRSLETMTTLHTLARMRFKTFQRFVDGPVGDVLEAPEFRHVLEDTKLGAATPDAPLLITHAIRDQVVAIADTDELADRYRRGGATVDYHRDAVSDHVLLHPLSATMTLSWLRRRLLGQSRAWTGASARPMLARVSTYTGLFRLGIITAALLVGRFPRSRRSAA